MVPIHEDFWTRTDGLQVDREHLLMALADVDFILVRASDNDKEPRLPLLVSFLHNTVAPYSFFQNLMQAHVLIV